MLKKILLIIAFISPLFLVSSSYVYSQEPPQDVIELSFDEIYEEYINISEEYNSAHADYVLKRAQYLKFKSLKSEQDAYDATLLMLEKRDGVVISYLKVLRKKIQDGIGISDAKKEGIFFRIDEEIAWHENHRDNLSTTGTLSDLVKDSQLAAGRLAFIDLLAHETMSLLAQGKIIDFDERLDDVFTGIKDKLEDIRNEENEEYTFSSSKFQVLDRWVFEAEGKIVRSREKQVEAENLITTIAKQKSLLSAYNLIISKLVESQLYMKEADLFLKEIIRQVKTEE